jgi:hypothetical protein
MWKFTGDTSTIQRGTGRWGFSTHRPSAELQAVQWLIIPEVQWAKTGLGANFDFGVAKAPEAHALLCYLFGVSVEFASAVKSF